MIVRTPQRVTLALRQPVRCPARIVARDAITAAEADRVLAPLRARVRAAAHGGLTAVEVRQLRPALRRSKRQLAAAGDFSLWLEEMQRRRIRLPRDTRVVIDELARLAARPADAARTAGGCPDTVYILFGSMGKWRKNADPWTDSTLEGLAGFIAGAEAKGYKVVVDRDCTYREWLEAVSNERAAGILWSGHGSFSSDDPADPDARRVSSIWTTELGEYARQVFATEWAEHTTSGVRMHHIAACFSGGSSGAKRRGGSPTTARDVTFDVLRQNQPACHVGTFEDYCYLAVGEYELQRKSYTTQVLLDTLPVCTVGAEQVDLDRATAAAPARRGTDASRDAAVDATCGARAKISTAQKNPRAFESFGGRGDRI